VGPQDSTQGSGPPVVVAVAAAEMPVPQPSAGEAAGRTPAVAPQSSAVAEHTPVAGSQAA